MIPTVFTFHKEPRLTLVGAGPGDPELITLKGVNALKQADVVLFDALVSEDILNLIPVWVLDGGQAARVLDRGARLHIATLALMLWILFGESVFGLVTAGAAWRAFRRDVPASPSRGVAWYFAALLVSLGLSMWLMPGSSAGFPESHP